MECTTNDDGTHNNQHCIFGHEITSRQLHGRIQIYSGGPVSDLWYAEQEDGQIVKSTNSGLYANAAIPPVWFQI